MRGKKIKRKKKRLGIQLLRIEERKRAQGWARGEVIQAIEGTSLCEIKKETVEADCRWQKGVERRKGKTSIGCCLMSRIET